jgi:hypothetical protein
MMTEPRMAMEVIGEGVETISDAAFLEPPLLGILS